MNYLLIIRKFKILFKFLLSFLVLMIVLVIISSPLARYLLEKYDVKYTGRQIEIGHVYLNPLTGNLKLKNLRIYEENSETVFFSSGILKINLSILRLLKGTYQVNSFMLDKPEINIARTDSTFNISDLIQRFIPAEKDTTKPAIHFNILDIWLKHGVVIYNEPEKGLKMPFTEIEFISSGKYWDRDSVNGRFSFIPGKGRISGNFMVNAVNKDYHFDMRIKNVVIDTSGIFMLEQKNNIAIGAILNSEIKAKGNYGNPLNVSASGRLEADNFHLGKTEDDRIASFKKFIIKINEADIMKKRYYIDSILLDSMCLSYERYDSLDNIRRLFTARFLNDTMKKKKDSVNMILKVIDSDYYLKSLLVKDANLKFSDYSIAEKFTIALHPFEIKADSIDKFRKHLRISVKSKIMPYGLFTATLSMDPKNERNIDLVYRFADIPATMFNPYVITFTSHELDNGKIEFNGTLRVRNAEINSNNHFLVIDPSDIKKKVKGKESKSVPLPIIMAFVRERGSFIDYEIPVTGNLKDPKFHLSDVITDIMKNILVKPPATPYRLKVKNIEKEVDKTLYVKWRMREMKIENDQAKFMKKIGDFLKDNKEAFIIVHPVYHEAREKENILIFEAKKQYLSETGKINKYTFSKDDSMKVENISSKDSNFIRYLNKALKKPLPPTIQAKCYRYVGKNIVDKKYEQMVKQRKDVFLKYFKDNGTINQVEFLKEENQVPYTWFSYFRIDYKGEIPESLKKAFDKLYEINSQPPREHYFNLFRRRP